MLNKKTKVVCTIGPSSWDPSIMKQMVEAGMNCARVNGAFADPAELDKVTKLVRDVSDEVALMMDVKGPEVRMNKFPEPIKIKPGDQVVIGNSSADQIYPANYKDLYLHLKPGQRIVVGDGDVELTLKEIKGDKMYCEVVFGENFKPGKALNLPGAVFDTTVLTQRDIENLKHSIQLGWDFVSASFIQNANAGREVRKHLEGSSMQLIAKIEDKEGIDNIDEILEVVDGIMIARGGLGVELGLEKVPLAQRLLTAKANAKGKPAITATQMLESMTYNPRPTRAEVNDVATAILLGSDAVMLSGESSAGEYPVDAVKELTKISLEIEGYMNPMPLNRIEPTNLSQVLAKKAEEMSNDKENAIEQIVVISSEGEEAKYLGQYQVKQPVFAVVSDGLFKRRLMLCKGIDRTFVHNNFNNDVESLIKNVSMELIEKKALLQNNKVLFVVKTSARDEGIVKIVNV